MASGIKLTFTGFSEMIERINVSGGDINAVVNKTMKKSANVQHEELKMQMHEAKFKSHSGVEDSLINRMPPPSVEWEGNRCTAEVGYKKGSFDKNNPSDAYKAIFLNYGTPRIAPTNFINKSKKKAKPQIKKAQEEAFNDILRELGG